MKLPRVRFTIRRLMLALSFLPPVHVRLAWLYDHPPPTFAPFVAGVNPVFPPTPATHPRPKFHPVGQPFAVECDYETGILPGVPTGLPYRARVEVSLINNLSKGRTVFELHRKSFLLIAGLDSWKEERGRFACTLTPAGPGQYVVRYEIHFTDLFGREVMGACQTASLQAK
jgi:hypothetical protein